MEISRSFKRSEAMKQMRTVLDGAKMQEPIDLLEEEEKRKQLMGSSSILTQRGPRETFGG